MFEVVVVRENEPDWWRWAIYRDHVRIAWGGHVDSYQEALRIGTVVAGLYGAPASIVGRVAK